MKVFKIVQVFLFISSVASAKVVHTEKSQEYDIQLEEMASGYHIPWGFEFLGNERLIVGEKNGKLSFLDLKTQKKTPIEHSIPVVESGQGGLMDIKKHPYYPKTPWIYVTYTERVNSELTTVLARFQLPDKKVEKFERLLVGKVNSQTTRHFGSRIAFDRNNFLYFGIGDRGVRPNGQNLMTHAGSILRLTSEGKVPSDNPFVKTKNALPEIWSYGHRNPQGLVFDSHQGKLWEIEHGPRGGDEINIIQKGKNYGWPTISYGKEYSSEKAVGEATQKKGMLQPVHYYVPSIAPCGADIYHGARFSKWDGNLLIGALALTHLNRVVLKDGKFVKEERLLERFSQRIRQVKVGPDTRVYLSTDSGQILRMTALEKKKPAKRASR